MQWQADHRPCPDLVQSSTVTRTLHMEAQPSPSGTWLKGRAPTRKQMRLYSPQREALCHGMEGRSIRQTRGNAYLTGVTTRKFQ